MAKTADSVDSFAFCRECNLLEKGKVRVRCGTCRSEAYIFDGELPRSFSELDSVRLFGECLASCSSRTPAQFYTKCNRSSCNSSTVFCLDMVRCGVEGEECSICGSDVKDCLVVEFGCGCVLCAQDYDTEKVESSCFSDYCRTNIESAARSLVFQNETVTFGCPNKHSNSWIRDIQHFRLAGPQMWNKYKDFAAKQVVEEICPKCNCGIVGLPEENRVECPNCSHGYCRKKGCYKPWPRDAQHECDTAPEAPSLPGSKICPTPGCPAPHIHYFKHECHHIGSNGGCILCGAHFCYQCLTIQDCLPQCHHGTKDTCPCPLFCPNDRSCGCPICPGCPDYGGECPDCKQCKGGCKHSKD